jgi:hypothetical protein
LPLLEKREGCVEQHDGHDRECEDACARGNRERRGNPEEQRERMRQLTDELASPAGAP